MILEICLAVIVLLISFPVLVTLYALAWAMVQDVWRR